MGPLLWMSHGRCHGGLAVATESTVAVAPQSIPSPKSCCHCGNPFRIDVGLWYVSGDHGRSSSLSEIDTLYRNRKEKKSDIERVCRTLCRISTAHRARIHRQQQRNTARFRKPSTMALLLLLTGPPERSYLSPHLSPSLTCMVQCNIPAISRGTSPVGTHSSMPLDEYRLLGGRPAFASTNPVADLSNAEQCHMNGPVTDRD